MVENDYFFPHPETSDKQGLLAIGGDLCPQRVLKAYYQGIFPWFEPGCPILWWSPNPRLILYPDQLNVSASLKKSLKKPFRLSVDTAFQQVITACATSSGRLDNTWITRDMIDTYTTLHAMGYAHSFEVWQEDELVGGLYGISLGKAFFGESMFHKVTDTSKIALYFLCHCLQEWEFDFIDCQMPTNHLLRLGAKIISRKEFLHLLGLTLKNPDTTGTWEYSLQLPVSKK
ncbi:leucyl/phenylalanyl-tRNA--protein transferase [Legionella worsleiensis]|uniref:Leucyl/phenylalanyl-tRNA--protein transferase n=1 Tax=Legionella worsleiensis TaxID=45076 RepID=A0A0W1A482_9GAMM|nr:leucyl/phenylalanyl-tRNA--protein transferase [Legionella worsleiensis]KTD76167.1 leucyl/phenylalanyl-tRNA--protein transferase [Legionella worsleiensis]STY33257.1 leucyl/phenylalanyl-tRNA--protein transferase [Legionella worsleiensis]